MHLISKDVPIISAHDTYISADPIFGCPAKCRYCFVQKYGATGSKPIIRVSPAGLIEQLQKYLGDEPQELTGGQTCVCLGNHTDMFMTPLNTSYAVDYATLHAKKFPSLPLIFITKAKLTENIVRRLDDVGHPMIIFFSQSFFSWTAKDDFEKGVSNPEITADSISLVADSRHIKAIHFWRPIISVNVPNESAARRQIQLIKSAKCTASVAVGLKYGEYLANLFENPQHPMYGFVQQGDDGRIAGESFPPGLQQIVMSAARREDYPVYLNTSCALSFALGRHDFLSTFSGPIRRDRCEPANCPDTQRRLCDIARAKTQPLEGKVQALIADSLIIPHKAVTWNSASASIQISTNLCQDTVNRLQHRTGRRVQPVSVKGNREWIGTSRGVGGNEQLGLPIGPPQMPDALRLLVNRMRGITGMISPIGPSRHRVFSRFGHVRRVAIVAAGITNKLESLGRESDWDRTRRLVWLHDSNRLPFAHNCEKGLYDQSGSLASSFQSAGVLVSAFDTVELQQILEKTRDGLSTEGRITLAADRATGVFEDIILAITCFRLSPDCFPSQYLKQLELPLNQPEFVARLWKLHQFFAGRTTHLFESCLDRIVCAFAIRLATRHIVQDESCVVNDSFENVIVLAKQKVLRELLYPIGNQGISHGNVIRERLVQPFIEEIGSTWSQSMLNMDDASLVRMGIQRQWITKSDLRKFVVPNLNYIEQGEGHRLFIGDHGGESGEQPVIW